MSGMNSQRKGCAVKNDYDEVMIPRVGAYALHPEVRGVVRICAVWRWPILYTECLTLEGGRFSTPASQLSAVEEFVDIDFEEAAA